MNTCKENDQDSRCLALIADGWKEYPNQFRKQDKCFFKRFNTPTKCHGNSEKSGIQIQISVSEFQEHSSMEMELIGELKDGTWVELLNYSLPATVDEVTALIPRILAIWEAANSK